MGETESSIGSVWHPYGLASNPFFTQPLDPQERVRFGIHLFRGTEREQDALKIVRRIISDDNSVTLIEGPSGIGKTTLANLVKHRLSRQQDCAVYPGVIQVDIKDQATLAGFVAELLHATLVALGRVPHAAEAAREAKNEAEGLILDNLISAGAGELSLGHILGAKWTRTFFLQQAERRPPSEWVDALQNIAAVAAVDGIERIVVHVNNLDQSTLTDADAVGHFFGQIRDVLQTPRFHFLLCANDQFRVRALTDRPNVTDIIGTPIRPTPLTQDEIAEIVAARYEDARLGSEPFTPPIEPSEAAELFSFFEGELRAAFEMLGQTFMQELGPTGHARLLTAADVRQLQTPRIDTLLSTLPEPHLVVLAAVADRTRKQAEVRQNELVAFLQETLDDPPTQATVSKIARTLSQEQWLVRRQQNARATFYSLGGRAKIVRPKLLAQLAQGRSPLEKRLTDWT